MFISRVVSPGLPWSLFQDNELSHIPSTESANGGGAGHLADPRRRVEPAHAQVELG